MTWPHVKEGRGGYHHEDVKHASAEKENKNKGMPNKRWLRNMREDMEEYNVTEEMADNRSVWHMKIIHGGGLV